MKVVGISKIELTEPAVLERIKRCPFPGIYLWEYLGYTIRNGAIWTTTIYTHEPEWLSSEQSVHQRQEVLAYLKGLLGNAFSPTVFAPCGQFIRLDPSFRSSDSPNILRIEIKFNSHDVPTQTKYIQSVIDWVCGRICWEAAEVKMPRIPAYHCAIELDVVMRQPVALRLYFQSSTPEEAFMGITILKNGTISSIKHYHYATSADQRKYASYQKDGMYLKYVAQETTITGSGEKIYLFNKNWHVFSRNM